VNFIKCRML